MEDIVTEINGVKLKKIRTRKQFQQIKERYERNYKEGEGKPERDRSDWLEGEI